MNQRFLNMISIGSGNSKHSSLKIIITLSNLLFIWSLEVNNNSKLFAQITPDTSLGKENSIVTPNREIKGINSDLIEGGAIRGSNLFHSFKEFKIESGRGAYFNIPSNIENNILIENIFGRVTGGNESHILGTLGVLGGNANLFLLNPNGIIFGRDASLDMGGSFLATTADSFLFNNGFEFGANNLEAPPLLTVSIPIGLQFGSEPGNITNRSQAGVNSFGLPAGLEVSPSQTLALVGGNVFFEGGNITTKGRIELGSVASNSLVNINPTESGWQLNYEEVQNFQDIKLSEGGTAINFSSEQAGEIHIQGKRIVLTDGALIVNSNLRDEAGGTISLIASEAVELRGISTATNLPSLIETNIDDRATGSASNVIIKTPILSLLDGGQINAPAGLSSQAKAGNITIEASELIEIIGTRPNNRDASSITNPGDRTVVKGDGGIVDIKTQRLVLKDGGRIDTSPRGSGRGGSIKIDASETVELSGKKGSRISGLFAPSFGTEEAGDIEINTRRLLIQDGAGISNGTLTDGRGGKITVNSSESVLISGISTDEEDNSRITATTSGTGAGGNVQINTQKLILEDGGQILAATFGNGDAGNIEINASELIEVIGSSGQFFSVLNSRSRAEADEVATGDAGDLTITTGRLTIRDGGGVSGSTFGSGQGGEVRIEAADVEIIGVGSLVNGEKFPSIVRARTLGSGRAGDINIITETLTIKEGADIAVSSTASGDAGNLNIFASDILITDNGTINVSATGTGQAGSLNINVPNPDIPVNINLDQVDITLDNGSLTAETRTGDQGNITIDKADTLLLRNNSTITTDASEQATGGDITLTSDVIALLNNSNITAKAIEGRGGNILITTQGLFQEPNSQITAASELGIDGTISINTPDVDPASGLVELPDVPVDVSALLARNICDIGRGKTGNNSSFIDTGRGGLPPNPYEPLESNNIFVDVQLPTEWRKKPTTNSSIPEPATKPILEANAWLVNEKGNVELVSQVYSKNLGCR